MSYATMRNVERSETVRRIGLKPPERSEGGLNHIPQTTTGE